MLWRQVCLKLEGGSTKKVSTDDSAKCIYPHGEVHMIPRADHFLQEDAPEEICEIIVDFLKRNP